MREREYVYVFGGGEGRARVRQCPSVHVWPCVLHKRTALGDWPGNTAGLGTLQGMVLCCLWRVGRGISSLNWTSGTIRALLQFLSRAVARVTCLSPLSASGAMAAGADPAGLVVSHLPLLPKRAARPGRSWAWCPAGLIEPSFQVCCEAVQIVLRKLGIYHM